MTIKEYQGVLDIYINIEARISSEKFLAKYWLSNIEMKNVYYPIKHKIFNPNSEDLPDVMFKKDFELIAILGGCLFDEEAYYALQKCMKVAKDEYFIIIENEFTRNTEDDFPHLRFKFPVDTTWEELNNGDENSFDISYELVFSPNKNFFVFGDSGKWGKFVASDYCDTPLDIIGFKPELSSIFQEHFKQSKEEQEEIWEWLPQEYKKLITKIK